MKKVLIFVVMVSFGSFIFAQKTSKTKQKEKQPQKDELAAYQYQAERLVEYFSETLNFLGDSTTIAKERQIVTNESYLKIFKNEEVQIEDDLIEDRIVPVYKDVRAYLRDVGYFYKHVEFKYEIQEIKQFYNSRQELNYLVTVNRHLKGITIKNELVENNMIRYIEIDLDYAHEVLKILSIYSTRLEEKEDIELWWSLLPDYWKSYFATNIKLDNGLMLHQINSFKDSSVTVKYDSIVESFIMGNRLVILNEKKEALQQESYPEFFNQLKTKPVEEQLIVLQYNGAALHSLVGNMMKQVAVDIHGETKYLDLSPLAKMTYLNELNISGTHITDLSDLRNLSNLIKLNISDTKITDLTPLQFLLNLKELIFNNTRISDISTLANNASLEVIEMNNTLVSDISSLARLSGLERLRMNKTNITDISVLKNNKNMKIISFHDTKVATCNILKNYSELEMVGMNNTKVSDISSLAGLKKLKNIFIDNTAVSNILCLTEMEQLERIYCDGSKVNKKEAVNYMSKYPDVLVVFETEVLNNWWNNLSTDWKTIWRELNRVKKEPIKDQLHQMVITKKLNLSYRNISQIECLSEMLQLEDLDISHNEIQSIQPLSNITSLINLNISKTKVSDLAPLSKSLNIKTLIANETSITDISPLAKLNHLTLVECDNCNVTEENVNTLREHNPNCLVIYRTSKNQTWWDLLSKEWKKVFLTNHPSVDKPDKYLMQEIVNQKVIDVKDNRSIVSLEALQPFKSLQKLIIANTGMTTLDEIVDKTSITYLNFSNTPIEVIDKLGFLTNIDTLIMENTPVKKLDAISKINTIKYLNISGTQVKNLKPLTGLTELASIDFNNTAISNITPLFNLKHLTQMKAFRTKVASGKIDEFKNTHPECEVIYY